MCSIDAHDKQKPSSIGDGRRGGGNNLPLNSITEALVSLSETINFIDFWINYPEHNSKECSNMYFETMEFMFQ